MDYDFYPIQFFLHCLCIGGGINSGYSTSVFGYRFYSTSFDQTCIDASFNEHQCKSLIKTSGMKTISKGTSIVSNLYHFMKDLSAKTINELNKSSIECDYVERKMRPNSGPVLNFSFMMLQNGSSFRAQHSHQKCDVYNLVYCCFPVTKTLV